jgi:hypothetical protein
MAVETDSERKAVNIKWDANALNGDTVDLKAENADDVSTRPDIPNDGYAVITYPADYHGTSHVTITDDDGNVEEGDITV